MLQTTTWLGYISEFSCAQFRRRFDVPDTVTETILLLSTDLEEYVQSKRSMPPHDQGGRDGVGCVLIVGNHYSHKHVRETVTLLREQEKCPHLVILGMDLDDNQGVTCYRAGELVEELVERLYDEATVVLFPSHYEGFGLPIMHALAHRKPTVARALPVAEEIKARTRFRANLYLADTTAEMVQLVLGDLNWISDDEVPPLPVHTWGDTADALERGLGEARRRFSFAELCVRLQNIAACEALSITSSE